TPQAIRINTVSNGVQIRTYDGTNYPLCGIGALTGGLWYHLIVVYNHTQPSGTINGYLNGGISTCSVNDTTMYSNLNSTIGSLGIGGKVGGATPFNGSIDDVMIFNRSLSATERTQIYQRQSSAYTNITYSPPSNITDSKVYDISTDTSFVFPFVNYQQDAYMFNTPILLGTSAVPTGITLGTVDTTYPIFNDMNISNSTTSFSISGSNKTGLVGWWKFDVNSTNQTDSSGLGNNGAVSGAVWNSSGKIGGAYKFDGVNDYVDISNGNNFDFITNNFTISVWALRKGNGTAGDGRIVNKLRGSGISAYFIGLPDTGGVRYFISNNTSVDRTYNITISGNQWYYYTVTFSKNENMTLFINGIQSDSINISSVGNLLSYTSAYIGGIASGGSFNGSIDDVMIFNRSLSASEISYLYQTTNPTFQENANVTLTTTITDADTPEDALYYRWLVDGVERLAGLGQTSFNYVFNNQNQAVTLYVNDTQNNVLYQEWNVTEVMVVPQINFTSPTPANNTNLNVNSIYVNYSVNDTNKGYSFINFDRSLVGWWTMDDVNGSGSPLDISGYGNNGSALNGATQVSNGKFGKGFVFDGVNDYVQIGNTNADPLLQVNKNFTISAWANQNGINSEIQTAIYGRISTSSSFKYAYGLVVANTLGTNYTALIGNGTSIIQANCPTTTIRQWNFYTAVYNGTSIICYLNGIAGSSLSITLTGNYPSNGTGTIKDIIGAGYGGGPNTNFNGSIDDVMIFNRSLSAEEITALYNATQTYHNFTSLADGTHTITSYVVDIAGNRNWTELKTVNTDITYPTINVTSPLNTSSYNSSSVLFNVSSSEEGTGMIVPNLDNSLVSWWRMDDVNASGTGVTDYMGINNGSALGGAVQTSAGKFGKGFQFDGVNDKINTGSDIIGTGADSVCAWIYPVGWIGAGDYERIVNNGKFIFGITSSLTGSVNLTVFSGDSSTTAKSNSAVIILNTWQHVCGTRNSSGSANVYFNGALSGTANQNSGTPINGTTNVAIGANYADNTRNFNGSIDEVMIFNRSLSASEIASLYNATKLQFTQTGLTDGNHTFKAYSSDLTGNVANTSLINFGVDTLFPVINFTSPTPANNTYLNVNSIYVNYSVNETNPAYSFINFDRSLVGWWTMDDVNSSGSPLDISGYGNNGSAVGGAVQTSAGKFGKGFVFDGVNDYVDAGNVKLLSNNAFTISSWFKTGSSGNIKIYFEGNTTSVSPLGGLSLISGSVRGEIRDDNAVGGSNFLVSPLLYNDNNWHYAVFVQNSKSNRSLYVDGVQVATNTTTISTLSLSTSHIGVLERSSKSDYFNGSIDDVMIFNRSLSAEEITALYNATQTYHNFTSLSDGAHTITSYVVDSAGNRNWTELRSANVDTTAPVINITYPINNTKYNNIQLGINYTVSDSGVGLSSCWWTNNSGISNHTLASCGTNITGFNWTEGTNNIIIYANDSLNNLGSNRKTFILDTVSPIIAWYNPANDNSTAVKTNFNFNVSVSDTNLYQINLSVENSSGTLIYSNFTDNINGSAITIKWISDLFNISGRNDGNYTVCINATDSHTFGDIGDLAKGKKGETVLIFNTSQSPGVNISAYFTEKGGKLTDTPGTFKSDVVLIDNSYYKFSYNFTVIKPQSVLVLNISSQNKLVYMTPYSGVQGHFIFDKKYYIDFADIPLNMNFSIVKESDYNYVVRIGGSTGWLGNQFVNIDPAVGGLNNIQECKQFLLDTLVPTITLISPVNNSGDSDGNITFNYNVTDANLILNCSLILNGVVNQTNASITKDIIQNFTLDNFSVGNYNWSINCTDGSNNINNAETRVLSVITSNEFLGDTTDLSSVNISNITNLIIHNPEYGKINFSESVDLSAGGDINSYVNISFNRIEINSSALQALNKSARLTFYNLTYSNPRLVKDGSVCPSTICTKISYSGKTLIADVSGFSVYSLEETPVVSTPASETSGGGGGGGGGEAPVTLSVDKFANIEIVPESFNLYATEGIDSFGKLSLNNHGNNSISIGFTTTNLDNFISFEDNLITLNAGENKIIKFNIITPKEPGLYIGKFILNIGSQIKEIPFALNVKTKGSLFDIAVNIPEESLVIKPGNKLSAQINLIQMGEKIKGDVTMKYVIKDFNGKSYLEQSETIAVVDQKTIIKEFNTQNLPVGDYILGAEIIYSGGIATASSQFKISEIKITTPSNVMMITVTLVSIIIFVFLLFLVKKFHKRQPEKFQSFKIRRGKL
ncbi:MAG: LamG-like jellyroll fold domain-containing protein, partial [Nanoarchaeota archaeon]|nr:LamG-like jellyroll fold domain-containing protein [Nanoarchaeota archaeon]